MTPTMNLRPTPGTAELLEALDRSLSGGIFLDFGGEPTGLASCSAEGRIVVATAETYLGHEEAGPTGLSIGPSPDEGPIGGTKRRRE